MKVCIRTWIILMLVLGSQGLSAQLTKWNVGVSYGFGNNAFFGIENSIAYSYDVKLYELKITYRIKEGDNWAWDFVGNPQYNTSDMTDPENNFLSKSGYEFGLNLGVALRYKMSNTVHPYFLLSAGPHYISESLIRQSPGFIFSDNFELGFSVAIAKKVLIEPNIGFRHLSNASLKSPNNGINNFIYGVSILFNLSNDKDDKTD